MFAFIGLGNPGGQYQQHRHNAGFMMIDAIADYHQSQFKKAQQGDLAQIKINSQNVLLYKPMLYMNRSGEALVSLCRFYKLLLNNIFVFHDEIELDIGRIRVKKGGGNAGHNGLKDISQRLGNDYHRIRIGVSRPKIGDVSHYVLSNFLDEEQIIIDKIATFFAESSNLLIDNDNGSDSRNNSENNSGNLMQQYNAYMK